MKKFVLAGVLWVIASLHHNAYASLGTAETEQTAVIFSLPDELLYEVCRHLSPNDLLALARTSQCLRRIANDQSLWNTVEFNVKSWTEAPTIVAKYKHQNITFIYLYRHLTKISRNKLSGKPDELSLSYYPTLDEILEKEAKNPDIAILSFFHPSYTTRNRTAEEYQLLMAAKTTYAAVQLNDS